MYRTIRKVVRFTVMRTMPNRQNQIRPVRRWWCETGWWWWCCYGPKGRVQEGPSTDACNSSATKNVTRIWYWAIQCSDVKCITMMPTNDNNSHLFRITCHPLLPYRAYSMRAMGDGLSYIYALRLHLLGRTGITWCLWCRRWRIVQPVLLSLSRSHWALCILYE